MLIRVVCYQKGRRSHTGASWSWIPVGCLWRLQCPLSMMPTTPRERLVPNGSLPEVPVGHLGASSLTCSQGKASSRGFSTALNEKRQIIKEGGVTASEFMVWAATAPSK